jgi:hypothetical protein
VAGQSDSGIAIKGSSTNAQGCYGSSTNAAGVYGHSAQFDAIVGESQSDAHAGVTGRNLTNGQNGGVGIYGVGGQYAGKFDGNVLVNGSVKTNKGDLSVDGKVTAVELLVADTANVLVKLGVVNMEVSGDVVLTGGDCAEDFDIGLGSDVDPGSVMVLDEFGLLQICGKSYDKKVVGVVSGAGALKPGLILGRAMGSRDPGRAPLALVGKVYCKVDAQFGEIGVGDLLTTSPTPGHAMRADDPMKSFGAIIGKALGDMPAGERGLIPILVALQ